MNNIYHSGIRLFLFGSHKADPPVLVRDYDAMVKLHDRDPDVSSLLIKFIY